MTIKIKKVTRKGKVFYRFQFLGRNNKILNDLYNRKADCIKQVYELLAQIVNNTTTIIDVDGKEI